MRLAVFGGDERMQGALAAAKAADWDALHITGEEDAPERWAHVDAVMLPWPHSFREERLVGGEMEKERTLALLPPCRMLLAGSGVQAEELVQAQRLLDPAQDEGFLRANAKLTAEGAIARAMERSGRALLGNTCVVTGFGRIGQELVRRLCAMEAFVIVCARNEGQMRRAHELGAHPVPLDEIRSALRHADVVFNTIPAHVLGKAALDQIAKDALVIELASPPYGMNLEMARHMGVSVVVEGGLPGRYAAMDAGAALFDALQRAMEQMENEEGGKAYG